MTFRQKLILAGLLACLFSCHTEKPADADYPDLMPAVLRIKNTDLSNKLFFIGPLIDTARMEIEAGCDCCASNLAFIDDSSYIYEALCLEGNSYIKGNYVLVGDILIIRTDTEMVEQEYELGSMEEDLPTKSEIVRQEPHYLSYKVSELKGKQVIVYSGDDHKEYGLKDSKSVTEFLNKLRKEKVLRDYLTKI